MVLALEDNKGWNCLPYRVDALDSCNPLAVALLHCLWSSSMLREYNNYSSCYHTYYKACFVKVVGVFIKNTMLSLHVLYKPELVLYNLRILAESSAIVVLSIKLDLEL